MIFCVGAHCTWFLRVVRHKTWTENSGGCGWIALRTQANQRVFVNGFVDSFATLLTAHPDVTVAVARRALTQLAPKKKLFESSSWKSTAAATMRQCEQLVEQARARAGAEGPPSGFFTQLCHSNKHKRVFDPNIFGL